MWRLIGREHVPLIETSWWKSSNCLHHFKERKKKKMKPEELIKLILKKAREYQKRSESQKEADGVINKISQDLYMGLKHGMLRRVTVYSLKEVLRTLPENPTEEDINISINLIEAIILTVISSILSEGEVITMTPIKDKDKKQPRRKT